jgi:hypothetical protein|tara:strand:+ start:4662 stop:5102 length:441 start_codon:yes stop_codon:yes gene_type:complete
MSLYDGMGGEEVRPGSEVALAEQDPYFTGSVTSEQQISGLNLYATGSVGADIVINQDGALQSAGAGSPTVFGHLIQAGSGLTGAGSSVWNSFGTAFGAAPVSVTVSCAETGENIHAFAGSWVAGSFYVETESANQTFSWIAVGTRA